MDEQTQEVIKLLSKSKDDLDRRKYFLEQKISDINIELARLDISIDNLQKGQKMIETGLELCTKAQRLKQK